MDTLDPGIPFSSGDLTNLPIPPNHDISITDSGVVDGVVVDDLPKRTPGASFSCDGPPNACGACEVCQQVKLYEQMHDADETRERSDFDILNERVDELMRILNQHGQTLSGHTNVLNYLGQSMHWLTQMLSGVAKIAESMPGMGGMMARFLAPKGGK